MPNASFADIQHALRQHLETSKLLGVDFIPIAQRGKRSSIAAAAARAAAEPDTEHQDHESSGVAPTQAPASMIEVAPTSRSGKPATAASSPSSSTSPPLSAKRKVAALESLRIRHDATCPHCTTVTTHTQTVFGEGDPDAQLMFVGEAPGEEEDRTGRPFVGRAGQKLDEIIVAMGLKREQVYIANVLKSRPPENRTPLPHEISACGPFLAEQIRIIRPKAIVALGGPASKLMLETDVGITRLRGQWGEYRDGDVVIPIMPTFHPAYLLRNYTRETRQAVWSDMQAVLKMLDFGANSAIE